MKIVIITRKSGRIHLSLLVNVIDQRNSVECFYPHNLCDPEVWLNLVSL